MHKCYCNEEEKIQTELNKLEDQKSELKTEIKRMVQEGEVSLDTLIDALLQVSSESCKEKLFLLSLPETNVNKPIM